MITFPNAKINLGLNIISKRSDGYHNISSCFYPIFFTDILEIQKTKNFSFSSSGLDIPDNEGNNLCVKAFNLMRKEYGISNVSIHLHKIIPMGAGLGGGSADASFTLKMLNSLFELKLSNEILVQHAAQLGSDCPFFIENKPVIAEEKGFKFSPASIELKDKYLVLLNPGIHVSTAEAYRGVSPQRLQKSINEILSTDFQNWKDKLTNDFEASVFGNHQNLNSLKKQLYDCGADYASMTGSGSGIYGIFEKEIKIPSSLSKQVCWKGFLN